jgi:hypothetical protein
VFVVSVWPVVWRYFGAVDVAAGPQWVKALFTLSLVGVTVAVLAITLSFAVQLSALPFSLLQEMLLGSFVLKLPSGFVARLATAQRDARRRE